MASASTELLAVSVDGVCRTVPNTYEGIKDGVDQATIDFVPVSDTLGFYVDDEGMLNGSSLNFTASFIAGRVLYGPVVAAFVAPSSEGETLPPNPEDVQVLTEVGHQWLRVVYDAAGLGQSLKLTANAEDLPPVTVTPLD